jgi:hypothetical protein
VDVSKMQQLLEMRERIMAKEAEIAFNQAMSRLQPKLPTVPKLGRIEVNGAIRSRFARYEDIDQAIRPLLCAEGFSLSFNSEVTGQATIYYGTLAHSEGHSRRASMILPPDTSGSKNVIQALGSTVSYAKRYLVGMLLNIVTKDEDDDGEASGYVTEEQVNKIRDILLALQMTPAMERSFLSFAQASDVEQIQARDFPKIMAALREKLSKKPSLAPKAGV